MSISQNNAEQMGRAVARSIHEHWGLFLAEGIILVLLGIIAIVVPPIATLAFTILIGWLIVRSLTNQVGSAVRHIQSSSTELQAAANQQASGSREQATAMQEIATTINELLATSRQIADSAKRVAQIASETAGACGRVIAWPPRCWMVVPS